MAKAKSETGHSYLETITGDREISSSSAQELSNIPHDFLLALQLMMDHRAISVSRGVFCGGPVYNTVTVSSNGKHEYQELCTWPEEIRTLIDEETDHTFMHGMRMNLHEEDVGAGAGAAFFNMGISPIHVIVGTGRIGAATLEEAKLSLQLGHHVGLLLPPPKYHEVKKFLAGKSSVYPQGLPAYFPSLELEKEDLICGLEHLPQWLKRQQKLLRPQSFRGRSLNMRMMSLIMHYVSNYAGKRIEEDLPSVQAVLASL